MEVTTIGLDLGKDVFQAHGIAADGTVVFNPEQTIAQVLRNAAKLSCWNRGLRVCALLGQSVRWALDAVPTSISNRDFNTAASGSTAFLRVENATHYYWGQPMRQAKAVDAIANWESERC